MTTQPAPISQTFTVTVTGDPASFDGENMIRLIHDAITTPGIHIGLDPEGFCGIEVLAVKS